MRRAHVLLIVVVASGCSGIADFDVTQPIPEQRVQGSGIPAPLAALFPLPLDLDLSAQIQKQTTGPIDSVTLSSLTLTITDTARPSGDTDDWSFVEAIHVFVKSSMTGSTLPRVEIASIVAPGPVTTIQFTVDESVNLQPYVSEGSVVESSGSGRIPTDDVSYDGTGVFTVHPL
jgi:hypothetical protein